MYCAQAKITLAKSVQHLAHARGEDKDGKCSDMLVAMIEFHGTVMGMRSITVASSHIHNEHASSGMKKTAWLEFKKEATKAIKEHKCFHLVAPTCACRACHAFVKCFLSSIAWVIIAMRCRVLCSLHAAMLAVPFAA